MIMLEVLGVVRRGRLELIGVHSTGLLCVVLSLLHGGFV